MVISHKFHKSLLLGFTIVYQRAIRRMEVCLRISLLSVTFVWVPHLVFTHFGHFTECSDWYMVTINKRIIQKGVFIRSVCGGRGLLSCHNSFLCEVRATTQHPRWTLGDFTCNVYFLSFENNLSRSHIHVEKNSAVVSILQLNTLYKTCTHSLYMY